MKKNVKLELVNCARSVFAEDGYRGATLAKISERAGANIAAVNYHFGGKEKLFREVLRNAFAIADQTYPIRGGDTPELRLKTFIGAFVRRTYDPGPAGDFNRIMGRTVNDAGVPMDVVMEEVQLLEINELEDIVHNIIYDSADDSVGEQTADLRACVAHVLGTCTFLVHHQQATTPYFLPNGTDEAHLAPLIERLHRFALGGLQAVKGDSA